MSEQQSKLESPVVESLSDVAWARVERNVFSRLDGTITNACVARDVTPTTDKKPWVWFAVPAAAAAAFGLAFFTMHGPAGTSRDEEPSRVTAGASPSTVSFGDAHITLDAESAIVMDPRDGKPTAIVEDGAATFAVAPRGDRPPFVVLAGDATVKVIGTKFHVSRHGEHAAVSVEHGVVEIRFHEFGVKVAENEQWSSDRPGEVGKAVADDEILIDPVDLKAIDIDTPAPRHHKPAPAPAAQQAAPADPDRARYESLTKLEAKHPAAAMKGYLQISQGSGPWAEVALYAAARLAADRHDPRAQTLLTIYLRRFPGGGNAEDAQALLTRLEK